jgi:hypothetical protein
MFLFMFVKRKGQVDAITNREKNETNERMWDENDRR